MAARGPDGKGLWVSPDELVGFGHRRLSIIDLTEAGAQPMTSADGRFVITFNGEIYNYRDLRRSLEATGRVFSSQSDTEVLLHLFAEKGDAMARELRGMFAIAIWDSLRRSLLLMRDPYGIKPLYYSDDGRTLRFASQVKALLAPGGVSRERDPAGQVGFFLFGHVPEPFTIYRAIRALPAGSLLTIDRRGVGEVRRYHSIAGTYCEAETHTSPPGAPGEQRASSGLREALLESVRYHLVADVPVGAFLSAGIDSGALVGLMRDAGQQDIQTITLSFAEFRGSADDEAPLAAEVARLYGTRHATRVVSESEFASDLPRILDAMDQPSIDGVNTWFVSKAAHELGLKVVVSGLGGDELFGGYPSFKDIPNWVRLLGAPSRIPLVGRMSRALAERIGGALGLNPKAAGLLEFGGTYAGAYLLRRGLFMPWELARVLEPGVVRAGLARLSPLDHIAAELQPAPQSPQVRVAVLESSLYMRNQLLRDTDWAGMAHSLEVRIPLVDSVLLSKVARLGLPAAGRASKRLLANVPRRPLPQRVTERAKTGFGIPVGRWMLPKRSHVAETAQTYARQWACFVAEVLPNGAAA